MQKLTDYNVSLQKVKVNSLAVGDEFAPIQYGEKNFTPFVVSNKNGSKVICHEMGKTELKVFSNLDRCVRVRRKDAPVKVRIIDMEVHSFAQKAKYRKESFQTFVSPMSIAFQKSDRVGAFEDMPTRRAGFALGSNEWGEESKAYRAFVDTCEILHCDYADFLEWAVMKNRIADFDETSKFGIVAFESDSFEKEELSYKGNRYVTFEESEAVFSMDEFAEFTGWYLTKRNK